MLVVDASVVLKWLLEKEVYFEQSFVLLQNHISKKDELLAPDIILYEVANTLATKTDVTGSIARTSFKKMQGLNLALHYPSYKQISKALKLAKKYEATVYDMIYAVIAREMGLVLVTADEQFIKKTGFKFVKHLKEVELPEGSEAMS